VAVVGVPKDSPALIVAEQVASSCGALHSYSTGGAGFESRPGPKLSSLRYVFDVVRSLHTDASKLSLLGRAHRLQNLPNSPFLI
jgi:hypothetical protein